MRASLAALEGRRFDLLVIGGGITGAGVARDAAMRGLTVAIVDKGDWGSGTSSRSSRLVHGGIRYLEHGEIALVRESVREREVLMRIAPHLVKRLEFTWPVYRGARLPRWKLRAGLALYDVLAGSRGSRKHNGLGVETIVEHEPMLRRDGLVGGASYYDAATDDVRLVLANVLSAVDHGAVAVSYGRVVAESSSGGRVDGAVVRDELGGEGDEVRVSARVTVSATGPWQARGTKGVHIAVPRERIGNRGAITVVNPVDGRVMFVLPAGSQAIVGTTDTFTDESPDEVRAGEADVRYLLAAANSYFPDAGLTEDDVIAAWAGIRPLASAVAGADPSEISREHRIAEDRPGVITVSGGKLTTYRSMAEEVVGEVVELLADVAGRRGGEAAAGDFSTADAPLPGEDREALVADMAKADAQLARPLAHGLPYTSADLKFAVRHEMAVTIADVLMRRTHVAFETLDHGIGVAGEAARIMARLFGWSDAESLSQIEGYAQEARRVFAVDAGAR